MFFENDVFSVKIISVLDLTWDNRNDESDERPFHALSFRVVGDSKFYMEDDILDIKSGDIVFVPNYSQYRLETGEEQLYVIHFTADKNLYERIKKFVPENPNYYQRKFSELYSAWTKKQTGYEYECKSIFFKILMRIERELEQKNIYEKHDNFSEAVEYIHEHFTDKNLTVDYLAKFSNMSETYFRRLFAQYFETSPKAFINNLKLQYAIELLESDYYTVAEVADKCGFENVYYFSNFIKKRTGKSPISLKRR